MFNTFTNTRAILSNVSGEVPTLEEVKQHGVAINVVDLIMFTIEVQGELTQTSVTVDLIEELTGMSAGITGKLKYIRLHSLPYSLVRMDDIGTIVEPGDKIKLPYGKVVQVAFISNDDTIAVMADLPATKFEEGRVERYPSPLTELDNPTLLSEMWDSMVLTEDTELVEE